uniref:Uncharacterized protein n=1 Tax=Lepeophtheirus salmonis TaxID=72036 RepID=A0A0K2T762_LEPSM
MFQRLKHQFVIPLFFPIFVISSLFESLVRFRVLCTCFSLN